MCASTRMPGENGQFGREEIDHIAPGIRLRRARGIDAQGPVPFRHEFSSAPNMTSSTRFVTMYHDQGQIAMKLMGFDRGVTIQGGLPVSICHPRPWHRLRARRHGHRRHLGASRARLRPCGVPGGPDAEPPCQRQARQRLTGARPKSGPRDREIATGGWTRRTAMTGTSTRHPCLTRIHVVVRGPGTPAYGTFDKEPGGTFCTLDEELARHLVHTRRGASPAAYAIPWNARVTRVTGPACAVGGLMPDW